MRAAVIKGGEITIERLPDPVPGEGQLLVAPRFTGICGSDLHVRASLRELAEAAGGDTSQLPPIVPGHEFVAEVIELGANADMGFKPGDRVVPIPFANSPMGMQTIGLSPVFSGGIATACAVVADRCYKVPDDVPDDLAALTEPLSVGRHAANLANRQGGPNLVIGCGPVGLAVLMSLKAQGRGPILVADYSPERRAIAEALGADIVIDPALSSPYERWEDLGFVAEVASPLLARDFSGRPRGLNIFECVGMPGIIDQIIKAAPQHSHVVVVGVCSHVDKHTPLEAITRELTVEYSFAYRPEEFHASLMMIQEQPEQVARLITSCRPLAETAAAFDALASSPSEIKILIDPRI